MKGLPSVGVLLSFFSFIVFWAFPSAKHKIYEILIALTIHSILIKQVLILCSSPRPHDTGQEQDPQVHVLVPSELLLKVVSL